MPAPATYWILTIPADDWAPTLPDNCNYIRGQREVGAGGYEHWQVLVAFKRQVRLAAVKAAFTDTTHAEPSRSNAADEYVWKADTRVAGTQFELGNKPIRRNSAADWARIRDAAIAGDLRSNDIPPDVLVRHIGGLQRVRAEFSKPIAVDRHISVLWGPTGTGKTFRAWQEAGNEAYVKNPSNRWWDGYQGESNIIIDEFDGGIPISDLLRYLDRYPLRGETKGSTVSLNYRNVWITSNLHPREWYPEAHRAHIEALYRRCHNIICMEEVFVRPESPELIE